MTIQKQRPGLSVIEVILALGMIVVIAAATSNLLGAIHRTNTASSQKAQALELAREQLDIVNNNRQKLFGCSVSLGGTITGPTCTIGGQHCDPLPGYSSCWVPHPGNTTDLFNLSFTAPNWTLPQCPLNVCPPDSNGFVREISITNQVGPTDPNVKTITATIKPPSGGSEVKLTTVITGWKNVP